MRRTTRYLVLILLVVLMVRALEFIPRPSNALDDRQLVDPVDFTLELFGDPGWILFEEGAQPELPSFDPKTDRWIVYNEPIYDLMPYMESLELGYEGSDPHLLANLSEDATVEEFRMAIVSLAKRGVCKFGAYRPLPDQSLLPETYLRAAKSSEREVPVYNIASVRLQTGVTLECKDRFPSWP